MRNKHGKKKKLKTIFCLTVKAVALKAVGQENLKDRILLVLKFHFILSLKEPERRT